MPIIDSDVPALVLDCYDHGESDKIMTFFCRGIGRLSCIAKGAHRSRKRFVNKLELFSFLQISYSRSRTGCLAVVRDAELLNGFINLRSSVSRYQAASVFREFLLLATSEQLNEDALFQLSLWTFHALDKGAPYRNVLALSLVKLFDYIGYQPDFSRCRLCECEPSQYGPALLSPQAGGLICGRCRPSGAGSGWSLSPGSIHMVISIQQQPLARLNRFKPTKKINAEVLGCFYHYGRHVFQKEIHSWKYLQEK